MERTIFISLQIKSYGILIAFKYFGKDDLVKKRRESLTKSLSIFCLAKSRSRVRFWTTKLPKVNPLAVS